MASERAARSAVLTKAASGLALIDLSLRWGEGAFATLRFWFLSFVLQGHQL
ncbi:hypothetical protein BRPE64_ECDS00070 (plasmid) [Caballeronia insecticola]|uniref:Uncharacterized protein n=1 Tax=Caballeronia insecticola TaxID=758793 RepID=R4X1D8_9BURK|nr:hypothetical protein BRPE64_ECDS00070 [Caballeronia insecticola]